MKVTLISHLPSEDAVNLLIYTKLTRLTQGEETRLAEANKTRIEITPVSGERVQALVDEIYKQPREIAAKTGAALQ